MNFYVHVQHVPVSAECDPHSLTRLSFLLKGVQQELGEFCDVCVEVSDECFFTDILHQLEQCVGEGNMPDKDFISWEEDDTEEEALEASKSNSQWEMHF